MTTSLFSLLAVAPARLDPLDLFLHRPHHCLGLKRSHGRFGFDDLGDTDRIVGFRLDVFQHFAFGGSLDENFDPFIRELEHAHEHRRDDEQGGKNADEKQDAPAAHAEHEVGAAGLNLRADQRSHDVADGDLRDVHRQVVEQPLLELRRELLRESEQALHHLALGDTAKMLALYDAHICKPEGAFQLDLIDCSALLWRLRLQDVDVGDRWKQIADQWTPAAGLGWCAFNDWHAAMALVAAGRDDALFTLAQAQSQALSRSDDASRFLREVGLAATQGVVAHGKLAHDGGLQNWTLV